MITIVSGFQRCGSSLMCQMLDAGGLPVFHDPDMGYPSYETQRGWSGDAEWFDSLDGKAVKWLEPLRAMPPQSDREIRVLWMTRDHRQQAKSAVKFMRVVSSFRIPNSVVSRMADSV